MGIFISIFHFLTNKMLSGKYKINNNNIFKKNNNNNNNSDHQRTQGNNPNRKSGPIKFFKNELYSQTNKHSVPKK